MNMRHFSDQFDISHAIGFFQALKRPSMSDRIQPLMRSRWLWAGMLAVAAGLGIGLGMDSLSTTGKEALIVFALAVIAWSVLRLEETPVAIAGGLALIVLGAIKPEAFYAGMGDNLVWLLIASFALAAVLRQSGVADRFVMRALCGRAQKVELDVRQLFVRLTWMIAATAFIVPSTSGRAALLLPVYLLVAQLVPSASVRRGLALLFPTVILLSACASLLGAGAHLVAVDFMTQMELPAMGFAQWALLGVPFALASSFAAMHLIVCMFVDGQDRHTRIVLNAPAQAPMTRQQKTVVSIVVLTIVMWTLGANLDLDAAMVALVAALAATTKVLTGVNLKDALKAVEWNLILFLAATMVMGEALLHTGAAQTLADNARALMPVAWMNQPATVVLFVSLLSLLAHGVITSRTARAMVLVPTVALPLALGDMNPVALIFISVVASGFCQTFTVSAKPVALFAEKTEGAFGAQDLWRLSSWLLPAMTGLLLVFALLVWPMLGMPVTLGESACLR